MPTFKILASKRLKVARGYILTLTCLCRRSGRGVRRIRMFAHASPFRSTFLKPTPVVPPGRSYARILTGRTRISSLRRLTAPEPCLLDGSVRELVQGGGGILALIDQLVEWLEAAAKQSLNDPEHGWEPVRRDRIDDIVVADAEILRGLPGRNGGFQAFKTFGFVEPYDNNVSYTVLVQVDGRVPINRATLDNCVQISKDGKAWTGRDLAIVAWPHQRDVTTSYQPETVQTLAELVDRAESYGCGPYLKSALELLRRGLSGYKITIMQPLVVILLTRRPFKLVGSQSPIEICPYIIELSGADDLAANSNTRVRLAGHRDAVSPAILRRTSGIKSDDEVVLWSLVGCGSVGSKIAMHMARSGLGPRTLVDGDTLQPHNFARHSCLPFDPNVDSMFRTFKAHQLERDLARLGPKPEGLAIDIITLLESNELRNRLFPEGTRFLLNTTASHVVREALCSVPWNGERPVAIEACLMGGGKLAYFALEGSECNPSTSDLMVEFYNDLRTKRDRQAKAFGAVGDRIATGQGCGSRTMILPDDELSGLSAPLARLARDAITSPVLDGGRIAIGEVEDDGISIRWDKCTVPPYLVLDGDAEIKVRLAERVTQAIDREIAYKPGSETGGILVGRFCEIAGAFQVVDTLPAPADSKFSAEEFLLGKEGLTHSLQKLADETAGSLYAVGTWHNHLIKSGPSITDIGTAAKLARQQLFPLLMLIRLPEGFTYLIAEARKSGEDAGAPESLPEDYDGGSGEATR